MFGALIGGGLSLAGSIMGGNRALRAAELGAKSDADKLKLQQNLINYSYLNTVFFYFFTRQVFLCVINFLQTFSIKGVK